MIKIALFSTVTLAAVTATADAPARPKVPDVFDMTQADAEAALVAAGFSGRITFDTQAVCGSVVNGKIIEIGKICHQSPAAGQTMSPKLSLSVRIQRQDPRRGDLGNGRFWFLMPDLTGMTADAGRAKLEELGFKKAIKIASDPACKAGVICRQNPAPLTRADSTSEKLFVVGP
jgi:beta-lactam-binding protein with PASTA domain